MMHEMNCTFGTFLDGGPTIGPTIAPTIGPTIGVMT
jgi:hypothetical protein